MDKIPDMQDWSSSGFRAYSDNRVIAKPSEKNFIFGGWGKKRGILDTPEITLKMRAVKTRNEV